MLYLALLLLLFAVLLSMHLLMRHFGFRGVTYALDFSAAEVEAGETVILTETICNRKPLPMPWVKAELTTDAALVFAEKRQAGSGAFATVSARTRFLSSFYFLRPYAKIERHWQVTCTRRGIFSVSHAILVVSDLFGTYEQSRAFPEATATLMVLPTPLEGHTLPPLPARCMTGETVLNTHFLPDRFAVHGVRPYAPGDNLRDLCHTASARMGEPMVYRFQDTAEPTLTMVLDLCTRAHDVAAVSDLNAYERAISLCCAYLQEASARKLSVRFCANTLISGAAAVSVAARGATHYATLCRMLASLPEEISEPIPRTLRRILAAEPHTTVLCVTAHLSAELRQLASAHPTLTVISIRKGETPMGHPSANHPNVIFIPLV